MLQLSSERARKSRPTSAERGFTLIELMVVVVIVGIMATLATWGVRKYILAAKTSEAIDMIRAIKSAQESYKQDTFVYLDVSGSNTLPSGSATTGFYPKDSPGQSKHAWGDDSTDVGKAWRTLGVSASAPVQFVYGCAAGDNGKAVAGHGSSQTVTGWPASAGQWWYVVRAVGDLDGDGDRAVYASGSFTGQIFIDKEGE